MLLFRADNNFAVRQVNAASAPHDKIWAAIARGYARLLVSMWRTCTCQTTIAETLFEFVQDE